VEARFFVTPRVAAGFLGNTHSVRRMKTLLALSAAVLAALYFLPLRIEFAASILFTAGLVTIAIADYTRARRRALFVVPAATLKAGKERFGLAA
jgi:hypothetical protein